MDTEATVIHCAGVKIAWFVQGHEQKWVNVVDFHACALMVRYFLLTIWREKVGVLSALNCCSGKMKCSFSF